MIWVPRLFPKLIRKRPYRKYPMSQNRTPQIPAARSFSLSALPGAKPSTTQIQPSRKNLSTDGNKKPAFPKRRKTGPKAIQPVTKKPGESSFPSPAGFLPTGRPGGNRETIGKVSVKPAGNLPAIYSSRYSRRRSRTNPSINSGRPDSRNPSSRQGASVTSDRRSSFTT